MNVVQHKKTNTIDVTKIYVLLLLEKTSQSMKLDSLIDDDDNRCIAKQTTSFP